MHHFMKAYRDFPKGKLLKSESPDFILKLNPKKTIGIELTHLHDPIEGGGNTKIQVSSVERELVDRSQQLFERASPRQLYASFSFREDQKISRNQVQKTASSINRILLEQIVQKDNRSPFSLIIEKDGLPQCIESIYLLYHPEIKFAFWDLRKSFLMPEITEEIIYNVINEKNDKLPLYSRKKIDYFWLIISTDQLKGISSNYITRLIDKLNFNTGFHKLFLFELFSGKIFELL